MCRRREHIFGLLVPFFVDFSQEHEQVLKNSQPHKAIFLGGTKSFCEKTGSGATTGGILRVSPKKLSRKDDSKTDEKRDGLSIVHNYKRATTYNVLSPFFYYCMV